MPERNAGQKPPENLKKISRRITKADIDKGMRYFWDIQRRTFPTIMRESRVGGEKLDVIINR